MLPVSIVRIIVQSQADFPDASARCVIGKGRRDAPGVLTF
jgi:hypothetical protein